MKETRAKGLECVLAKDGQDLKKKNNVPGISATFPPQIKPSFYGRHTYLLTSPMLAV